MTGRYTRFYCSKSTVAPSHQGATLHPPPVRGGGVADGATPGSPAFLPRLKKALPCTHTAEVPARSLLLIPCLLKVLCSSLSDPHGMRTEKLVRAAGESHPIFARCSACP